MRQAMDAAIDEAIRTLQRARAMPSHSALEQLPAVAELISVAIRAAGEQVLDHERVEGRPLARPAAQAPQATLFAGGA